MIAINILATLIKLPICTRRMMMLTRFKKETCVMIACPLRGGSSVVQMQEFKDWILSGVCHSLPMFRSPTKWGCLHKLGVSNLIWHPVLEYLHQRLWGNAKPCVCSLQKQLAVVYRDPNFLSEKQDFPPQEQTILRAICPCPPQLPV